MDSARDVLDAARECGVLTMSARGGQVVMAELRPVTDEPAIEATLRALLPTTPSLQRLDIVVADTVTDVAAVLTTLLERPRTGLRRLAIREYGFDPADGDAEGAAVSVESMAVFAERLPDLEELELELSGFAVGLSHPTLKVLVLTGACFVDLGGLDLPGLERLTWRLPGDVHGVGVVPEALGPLWKDGALPRLRELDVLDVDFDGSIWTPGMFDSDLLGHLEVLRVRWIDDEAVLRHRARLARLRRIDVRSEPDGEVRRVLPMIQVVEAATVAGATSASSEMYVTAEEAFVFAWQGFAPASLAGLPDTVRSVALSGYQWSEAEESAFAEAASMRFTELHMPGGGRLSDDGLVVALARTLPGSRWETLGLDRAWLTRDAVAALAGALAGARTPLHTLTLRLTHRDLDVTDGAAGVLAAGLATTRVPLRTLTLHTDFIRQVPEAAELGRALPASLSSLRLTYRSEPAARQRRDPDALGAFLAATRERATLRRLVVVCHPAPPDLVDVLPPLDALGWREAYSAYRDDPPTFTGDRIAAMLHRQPSLRELDLLDTALGPDDVAAMAEAIAAHPALTSLRLASPVLSDEAMRHLARAVRDCTSLTSLTLRERTGRGNDYVSMAPLLKAVADSGRTFDELSLHLEDAGDDQLLYGLLADDRLRAVTLWPAESEFDHAMAVLTRATRLRRLALRGRLAREDHKALCRAIPELPLRELAIESTSVWEVPAASKRRLLTALRRSRIEVLRVPHPFPLVLGLAGSMPSLRRVRPLD